MKVAIYVRVSTEEQTLEQQKQPLVEYCKKHNLDYSIFEEKTSGAKTARTELDRMLKALRNKNFDAVLVAKLDRLGRSSLHLQQLIEEFNNKGIQFICLSPEVDTRTPQGMFFIQIMSAVAQLERAFIIERTKSKLNYLKKQGIKLGRPKGSKDKKQRRRSGYYLRWGNNRT